jgi:hypothetical protein
MTNIRAVDMLFLGELFEMGGGCVREGYDVRGHLLVVPARPRSSAGLPLTIRRNSYRRDAPASRFIASPSGRSELQ